jgi:hypothetical protein
VSQVSCQEHRNFKYRKVKQPIHEAEKYIARVPVAVRNHAGQTEKTDNITHRTSAPQMSCNRYRGCDSCSTHRTQEMSQAVAHDANDFATSNSLAR